MSPKIKIKKDEQAPAAGIHGYEMSREGSPLKRLNYFDGKFLRAEALTEEQEYFRTLVRLSGQAGGAGVVNGLEVELAAGDTLRILPGLAVDPGGRALLLAAADQVSVTELIARSKGPAPAPASKAGSALSAEFGDCVPTSSGVEEAGEEDLYLISAHAADWLCGQEDVYGLLCQQACYTETQHPYIREGIILRATPLSLHSPLPRSGVVSLEGDLYRRSRVASAYFADEAAGTAGLISRAGLMGGVWCRGAMPRQGAGVLLGVLGRKGGTTDFLDPWCARRELVETSPRRYWAWRMRMRPWDVFLAHVLQFQCHLGHALGGLPPVGSSEDQSRDHVRDASVVFDEIAQDFAQLQERYALGKKEEADADAQERLLKEALPKLVLGMDRARANLKGILAAPSGAPKRILLERGIAELPSAGYLPVTLGGTSVNEQVRALLGEGVDLRFCAVRPDFVAHALEEAQHMDRISLVQGLDDPKAKPRVDILVPDGVAASAPPARTGQGYEMTLALAPLTWLKPVSTGMLDVANKVVFKSLGATPEGLTAFMAGIKETAEEAVAEVRAAPEAAVGRATLDRTVAEEAGKESIAWPEVPLSFHGAARSEPLPQGGAAFYYAGLLTPQRDATSLLVAGCEEDAVPLAVETKSKAVVGAAPAAPAAAAAGSAEVKEVERIVGFLRKESAAVWTALQADRDPFGLEEGDTTSVRLDLHLLMVRGREAVDGRVRVEGTFRPRSAPLQSLDGEKTAGTFTGEIQVDGSRSFFNGVAQIRRTAQGAHPDVELWIDDQKVLALSGKRRWKSDHDALACGSCRNPRGVPSYSADAKAKAEYKPSLLSYPVFAAAQRLDDRALEAGHAAYADSADALDLFATHASAAQVAAWRPLLFPPPKKERDTWVLQPRHGWVLFHRRRETRCGEVERVTPVATHRYRVSYLAVDAESLKILLGLLRGGDDAAWLKLSPTPLASVDFKAGERNPVGAAGELVGAWLAHGLNAGVVVMGAVAAEDYDVTGGKELASDRLGKVLARLGQVGTVHDGVESLVLPSVPASLASTGSEGVMVLVTVLKVAEPDGPVKKAETKKGTIKVKVTERVVTRAQAGVTVRLSTCGPRSTASGSPGVEGICTSPHLAATSTTDASGTVTFTDLGAGFYQIEVDPTSIGKTIALPAGGTWVLSLEEGADASQEFIVA